MSGPLDLARGTQAAPPPGYEYVSGSPVAQYRPPGDGRVAVPGWVLVAAFLFALVAVVFLAAAAVTLLTPPPAAPVCVPGQPCAPPLPGPPGPGPVVTEPPTATPSAPPAPQSAPLVIGTPAVNAKLGYSVEYASDWWTGKQAAPDDIRLFVKMPTYGNPELWIHAAASTERTPEQLTADQLAELGSQIIGLTADGRPQNLILGPEIGYIDGTGSTFTGSMNTPQGPGGPVVVFFESASNGRLSASAALILVGDFALDTSRGSYDSWFRELADQVLNSFSWPPS